MMANQIERKFIGRREAATLFNVHWQTIRNWESQGAFPTTLRDPAASKRSCNIYLYSEVVEFSELAVGKPIEEKKRIAVSIVAKRVVQNA
jgi:hypothetical protein